MDSSPDDLTQEEVKKRLTQYWPNEIEEKKTNLFLKFLTYFWGPIPWMIEAAIILSDVSCHWPDFFIILILLLAIKACVKRGEKWINPEARDLAQGDIIRLLLGDIVPADARLLEGS